MVTRGGVKPRRRCLSPGLSAEQRAGGELDDLQINMGGWGEKIPIKPAVRKQNNPLFKTPSVVGLQDVLFGVTYEKLERYRED